jgi:hypothetical protein
MVLGIFFFFRALMYRRVSIIFIKAFGGATPIKAFEEGAWGKSIPPDKM